MEELEIFRAGKTRSRIPRSHLAARFDLEHMPLKDRIIHVLNDQWQCMRDISDYADGEFSTVRDTLIRLHRKGIVERMKDESSVENAVFFRITSRTASSKYFSVDNYQNTFDVASDYSGQYAGRLSVG